MISRTSRLPSAGTKRSAGSAGRGVDDAVPGGVGDERSARTTWVRLRPPCRSAPWRRPAGRAASNDERADAALDVHELHPAVPLEIRRVLRWNAPNRTNLRRCLDCHGRGHEDDVRASRLLALLVLACLALAGCGDGEIDHGARRGRADPRRRRGAPRQGASRSSRSGASATASASTRSSREFEKVVRAPERTIPKVRSRGRNEPATIDAFLTDVLGDVDRYWTRTFAAAGLPEPRVSYVWVRPARAS